MLLLMQPVYMQPCLECTSRRLSRFGEGLNSAVQMIRNRENLYTWNAHTNKTTSTTWASGPREAPACQSERVRRTFGSGVIAVVCADQCVLPHFAVCAHYVSQCTAPWVCVALSLDLGLRPCLLAAPCLPPPLSPFLRVCIGVCVSV